MTDAAPASHVVIVEPAAQGWLLRVGGAENPMLFVSGRVAEQSGRDLALRLANAGAEVRLELRLRGGAVAARFLCFPAPDDEDNPMAARTAAMTDDPGLSPR
ncbi:MAG: hypothetical protein REJ23_10465 [Brevundimonas sp.]|nr:hypothetical protein [Brevundimonas sp.]